MSRCGCAGACSCALTAGSFVTVSGSGTAASPWVVNASCACALQAGTGVTVTGAGTSGSPWVVSAQPPSCNTTMDCVGSKLGNGLAYNGTTRILSARFSADANNVAGPGADGGIYVPNPGAPGSASIIANDSAEVEFSGDGTAAQPLAAALTGQRLSDWVVGSGNIYVGSDTDTALRMVEMRNKGGPDAYRAALMSNGATKALDVVLSKNGTWTGTYYLGQDGQITAYFGGASRPVPFATFAGAKDVFTNASVLGSAALTFTTGRFTQTPNVQLTTTPAGTGAPAELFHAYVVSANATAVTVGIRHLDNIASTAGVWVNVLAMQMTPTSGPGLLAPDAQETAATGVTATCHTDGCENADSPAGVHLVDEHTTVTCGACGQPIDDIEAV